MKIKLCGMMRDADIDYANEARPDYVGFVFADSKRKILYDKAKSFRKKLHKDILSVGVFVNEKIENIQRLVEDKIIDIVQLHGNEDEEYIKKLNLDVDIIKAVRVGLDPINEILKADNLPVDYLLLEAYEPGTLGGTGKTFDWSMIPKINKPFFLAGGLNLENIDEAKKQSAYALDLSSGIETNGVKDREKMIEIVRRTKQ